MQLWHGTADTTLNDSNLAEEVDQWTNVWGLSDGTSASAPSGWERTVYESGGEVAVEVNIGAGRPHDLTGQGLWPDVVRFFGLDQDPPEGTGGAGGTGGAETGGEGTGGVGGTGGIAPTGGVPATGGTATSGGASPGGSPTGGTTTSGGTGPTTGGASTGGIGATPPIPGDDAADDGCSCRQGTGTGRDRPGALLALALAALGALGRRRWRG